MVTFLQHSKDPCHDACLIFNKQQTAFRCALHAFMFLFVPWQMPATEDARICAASFSAELIEQSACGAAAVSCSYWMVYFHIMFVACLASRYGWRCAKCQMCTCMQWASVWRLHIVGTQQHHAAACGHSHPTTAPVGWSYTLAQNTTTTNAAKGIKALHSHQGNHMCNSPATAQHYNAA
jgi:hypothetical protein